MELALKWGRQVVKIEHIIYFTLVAMKKNSKVKGYVW